MTVSAQKLPHEHSDLRPVQVEKVKVEILEKVHLDFSLISAWCSGTWAGPGRRRKLCLLICSVCKLVEVRSSDALSANHG